MDPLKPGCATVGETAGYKKQGAGSLKRNGRIQRERERGCEEPPASTVSQMC